MDNVHEYWICALIYSPKLETIVDQVVDVYPVKHEKMLRASAGFLSANGWLSPCIRDTRNDQKEDIDAILRLVIEDLQDAGLIPRAAWYQPVALFVLHFVVIPFLRDVLTRSHYPAK